jgi:hypothetical protein
MKRFLILATAALALVLLLPPPAWSFNWKDVAEMVEDSIPDQLIIEKITHSGSTFDLNARELHQLKAAGVSDQVITAMLRTEDRDGGDDAGSDGGYAGHPYVPYYWYDPYYYRYPGSGIVLDFGFGYGYGWGRGIHNRHVRGGFRGDPGYRGDGGNRGGGGQRGGGGYRGDGGQGGRGGQGGQGGRGGHGGGRH